jgi:hypothetical protein
MEHPSRQTFNRRFKFNKRSQLFTRSYNETFSVVASQTGNVIETHEHVGDFKDW